MSTEFDLNASTVQSNDHAPLSKTAMDKSSLRIDLLHCPKLNSNLSDAFNLRMIHANNDITMWRFSAVLKMRFNLKYSPTLTLRSRPKSETIR
ncbi:hypothetical protein [Halotalea alkalilenta]|uniref:hypothetical protein n=1 Tax=Halotalea alkalilenta TaxID=376489 RepID=UPI0012DF6AB1|nr:hypothetical protein [Halotalea alkalilenta]